MKEIWRDIEGLEGRYKISNLGRILSLPKKHKVNVFGKAMTERMTKERIISGRKDKDGYIMADLSDSEHKLHKCKVHRLVAAAFVERVDGKNIVNHKNGIKDDNRAENLEWVDNQENLIHAHHELYDDSHKYYNERKVNLYTNDMRFVRSFENITETAKYLGVSKSAISAHLQGKTKSCKGYTIKLA